MLVNINYTSKALCKGTSVNVCMPWPEFTDAPSNGEKWPVLYLLHGVLGDSTSWTRYTSIERYAQKYKMIIVMPQGDNSFYYNLPDGTAYEDYILYELPSLIETSFPASNQSDKRFIAGLSMGGFGALRLALTKPYRYSRAASLSGVVDIDGFCINPENIPPSALFALTSEGRKKGGIFALADECKKAAPVPPKLFLSCGKEDFVYEQHLVAKERLTGFDTVFEEHDGSHTWEYWDTHIQRVLQWLEDDKCMERCF